MAFAAAAALFLLLLPASPPSPAPAAGTGRLVRLPDGRRIYLRCEGRGSPTVVFEGGFAATSSAWEAVQPQIARRRRACAYDRAGYGLSDPGPTPRHGAAVARDLDQALRAGRVGGPFVLVGHSAGALYVRLFAERRRAEVVGMVLVDPSVEHQGRRFEAAFGPGADIVAGLRVHVRNCLAAAERGAPTDADPALPGCAQGPGAPGSTPGALPVANWRTQLSELDALWTTTSDQLDRARRSYGDMPLMVLTAEPGERRGPDNPRSAAEAFWLGLHQEIAARSSRGRVRTVDNSGHIMPVDRPDAVVQAIEAVIAEGRKR